MLYVITKYPALSEAQFIALRQTLRTETQRKWSNHFLKDPNILVHREDPSSMSPRYIEVWFKTLVDSAPLYVKIIDTPNQLSGNIIRGTAALPKLDTHTEITGDTLKPIPPQPPFEPEPLSDIIPEDVSPDLATLPIVAFDQKTHFAKSPKFRREVQNLIKCRGASPHIVEILGRTEDGQIVFPYLYPMLAMATMDITYALYRSWALQFAEALCHLHSLSIIHRDVAFRNVMVSRDLQRLVLIDLESYYGSNEAPELYQLWRDDPNADPDTLPYTEKTDVFEFGLVLKSVFLGRVQHHSWECEFGMPAPFDEIVARCMADKVEDRPTMAEVKEMIEGVEIPGRLCKCFEFYR